MQYTILEDITVSGTTYESGVVYSLSNTQKQDIITAGGKVMQVPQVTNPSDEERLRLFNVMDNLEP